MVHPGALRSITLLPNGKVLVAGGIATNGLARSDAELYDPETETWSPTHSMHAGHLYHSATLLRNGLVLVTGGLTNADVLATAELYDPVVNDWLEITNMAAPHYHHTSTLLPDGRVLICGGYIMGPAHTTSPEVFEADQGFATNWQPQIATLNTPLGLSSHVVATGARYRGVSGGSGGTAQDSPADHPLLQLRSMESGRTTFELMTSWSTNSFTTGPLLDMPIGWTLATVYVDGIPSPGQLVNILASSATSPLLLQGQLSAEGFQIRFTNSIGTAFAVLSATNLSLPSSHWAKIGSATETAPGRFEFTDTQATDAPGRFYRLRSP